MIARTDSGRRSGGFTLLEVLIGLVVLALALVALSRTAANQVNSFGALRERTFAGWLAQDVLTQSRLTNPFPDPGKTDGRRRFANRDWRYELEIESTDVPTIRRLDVRVFEADNMANPILSLTGFATSDLQP
jgi:general secretion pathway protein I